MISDRFSGFSRVCKFGLRRTSAKIIEMLKAWSLDYSYPEIFMSDGPQVFTSNEFNSWLKDNKITHRVSSPGRARSNGAIESKIKLYKSIRDKLVTDGKYSPGAMQEAWATAMDFPAEPGELAPSRLALLQDRRNPRLPFLPGEPGEEVDAGAEARKVRERRKVQRNEKLGTNVRKPPKLEIGLRVLVQNKKGVFCIPAKIISIRQNSHHRTAVVEYSDGSTQIRNRRFFIEDNNQPQVNNIVEFDDANSKFYFRLVKIDPDQVDGSFEVQKVKLNFIVRSCMKGIKSSVREKRTVSFAD